MPKGKITIYACGGAGMNIGSKFEKWRERDDVGLASTRIVYLDTSISNINSSVKDEDCYIIKGLDGSGKYRKENSAAIADSVKMALQQFEPTDLNIVVGSAAGGSGSVFAPLILLELLKNRYPTVVITIGSTDSKTDAENTLATIKSYESMAKKADKPVVMRYLENSDNSPRDIVDAEAINAITALNVLYSRDNRELDTKDLENWLFFGKVTSFREPILASLSFTEKEQDAEIPGNVISVATVTREGMSTRLTNKPEYQCTGYIPEGSSEIVLDKMPMHFIVSDGGIFEATKDLDKVILDFKKREKDRGKAISVLNEDDESDEHGLHY